MLRVVSCKVWFGISLEYQNNHCVLSLSATRVTNYSVVKTTNHFLQCIPRDSQCQYLIKCVGDQRRRCAIILIWHCETLVGSAIWHILAHRVPLIFPRTMAQHAFSLTSAY